jgi:hypothetical protein
MIRHDRLAEGFHRNQDAAGGSHGLSRSRAREATDRRNFGKRLARPDHVQDVLLASWPDFEDSHHPGIDHVHAGALVPLAEHAPPLWKAANHRLLRQPCSARGVDLCEQLASAQDFVDRPRHCDFPAILRELIQIKQISGRLAVL